MADDSFLGKKINLLLVIVLAAVVIVTAATTVFFNTTLQNRTSAYEQKAQSLQKCEGRVQNYKDRLHQTKEELNSTSQDVKKYDTLYENKVAELKKKKKKLEDTKSKLNLKTLEAEQFKSKYEEVKSDYQILNDSYVSKVNEANNLEDALGEACDTLTSLEEGIDECDMVD